MPGYVYKCGVDGRTQNENHSVHDDPYVECRCGRRMFRVIEAVPAVFYGEGFVCNE